MASLSFSLPERFASVVGAAEDVRGRERVHVCQDGGGGRDRRQRCQIECRLRSVVAPAEVPAQDGDTAVPKLLQGMGDGHERVEGAATWLSSSAAVVVATCSIVR